MTERWLKLLLRRRLEPSADPTEDCLGEETVAAYVEGHLEASARAGIEEHLAGCSLCRQQVGYLVRAAADPTPAAVPANLLAKVENLAKPRLLVMGWNYRWAAAAAMIVLTVGVIWQLQSPEVPVSTPVGPSTAPTPPAEVAPAPPATVPVTPPPPSGREIRSAPTRASLPELVLPKDGAELRRSEIAFRWRDVPGHLSYEVQVASDEGDPVWRSRAETNEAALPADVVLQPGQVYFVWVRAELQDGKTVRSSAVRFRIVGE